MKKLLMILPLVFLLCFTFSFQGSEEVFELEEQTVASNLPGFIFSKPAPNSDGKIKILLHFDMEGLSGQDDWRTAFVDYPEQYKKGQELLTADVNAVIEGLIEGGADEIYVLDGHGSGNPKPDIILEKMDSRAKLVSRSAIPEGAILVEYYGIDAIAAVGHHSRTGGGGFMPHTQTLGMDYIINGRSVNEMELSMLGRGRSDIPTIFASGDDKLKEQLQPYPWIEYVTVKYATSASSADLRPIDEVHNEMRMAASRAVKNISNAKAVKLKTPFEAGLRAVPPANLSVLRGVPGIDFHDNTVTFEAKNFREARGGMSALARVAIRGYDELEMETMETLLAKHYDPKKIGKEFWDALCKRWLDYESGRWKPPEK